MVEVQCGKFQISKKGGSATGAGNDFSFLCQMENREIVIFGSKLSAFGAEMRIEMEFNETRNSASPLKFLGALWNRRNFTEISGNQIFVYPYG